MLREEKKTQLINDYENWWEHKSERPMIQLYLSKKEKVQAASRGELLAMLYDFSVDPETVAKEYRKSFENTLYCGDAFPFFYMRSTGILGAMLGQTYNIDVERGTIWFEEMKGKELEDIHPVLEDENALFQRGLAINRAIEKEFGSDVAIGIPNLGGMMDIVESMRGANNSLIDLYDDPEEVIRLNDEIYAAYEKAYHANISSIDPSKTLGYTGWLPMLSQKPFFISQCDFCCMISPDHFKEFVFDTLEKEAQLIERSFYHLDGPGAIRHLDMIIEAGFDGIQWVQGAGERPLYDPCWDVVYKKVHEAGLLMELIIYGMDEMKVIAHLQDLLGDISHVSFTVYGNEADQEEYFAYLDQYHVPY